MKTKRTINMKNGKTETNTFNKTPQTSSNNYKNVNPRLEYPKGNAGPECKQCMNDCLFVVNIIDISSTIWDNSFNCGKDLIGEEITFIFPSTSVEGFVLDYNTQLCNANKDIDITLFITILDDNCVIPYSSSNIKILGINIDNAKYSLANISSSSLIKRNGAPFRAPLAGYRRTLVDCKNTNNPTNTVYGDSIYASDPKSCYDKQIRSGMQPKNNNVNKKNNCEKSYSFSYHEYNKNRALNTYERGLEHNKTSGGKFVKSTGSACDISCCNINNNTIWKPNNKPFKVQGAVSSSSRIDRLKLETLRVANSKCNKQKKS